MEKVSLYDRLVLEPGAGDAFRLTSEGMPTGVPAGGNTVERAAALLAAQTGESLAAAAKLIKEIPAAAGLAGGSSDAAAALRLLISTQGLSLDEEALNRIALDIGADVPFFLKSGAQLAEGVGELLTPVELPFSYAAVIVTPEVELSTARVYRLFDQVCPQKADRAAWESVFSSRCQQAKSSLASLKSPADLAVILHNDLEAAAASICPDIPAIQDKMSTLGAMGTLMSGSGPSVFGLFAGKKAAEAAAGQLRESYGRVWTVEPVSS